MEFNTINKGLGYLMLSGIYYALLMVIVNLVMIMTSNLYVSTEHYWINLLLIATRHLIGVIIAAIPISLLIIKIYKNKVFFHGCIISGLLVVCSNIYYLSTGFFNEFSAFNFSVHAKDQLVVLFAVPLMAVLLSSTTSNNQLQATQKPRA